MRIRISGIIFLGAAFPFIIPLVPSTDTQPTFSLFAIFFAAAAAIQCINRRVMLRRDELLLAGTVVGGGIIWLCASLLISDSAESNINRVIAFVMLLIAIAAGVLNHRIFTEQRLLLAFAVYIFFTLVFFITGGMVESFLIKARGDEISQLLLLGRGASTLSPEPSFFAFQIFTLFLGTRLTVWSRVSRRSRHLIQLISIGLLTLSFSGFGILYAAMVILLSGRRYVLAFSIFGTAAFLFLLGSYKIDSLRFVNLILLATSAISTGALDLKDLSILGRLSSFQDYIAAFQQNPFFGDAFEYYGGGGLVSVLAALGVFGILLTVLAASSILNLRKPWPLKFALLVWLTFQFISGPVGLPLVGLTIGIILRQARLGALLSAMGFMMHRGVVR